MNIYHYDNVTGEYIKTGTARLDPKEWERGREVYLCPAYATFIAPSSPVPDYVMVFIDGGWQPFEDHRGTVYRTADGASFEYVLLGPLPSTVTTTPRPSDEYVWVEGAWVVDQIKVDARLAREAFILAKAAAIANDLPSLTHILTNIDGLDSLAKMRGFLKKFATVVYYEITGKAE